MALLKFTCQTLPTYTIKVNKYSTHEAIQNFISQTSFGHYSILPENIQPK